MVKAADAACEAGFDVRLVSVDYVDWMARLDPVLVARRRWRWQQVRLRRSVRPVKSRWVSARHRGARALVGLAPQARWPMPLLVRAYARTHGELVKAILMEPFDLLYGGTVAALAAVAEAARRARRPFGLDFEDYHPAESEEPDAPLTHALARAVVREAARGAAFLTAASEPIAEQFRSDLGADVITLHNVTPLSDGSAPLDVPAGAMRIYWFSQVVGPKRGLEEMIAGLVLSGVEAEFHLRGAGDPGYIDALRALATAPGSRVTVRHHGPAGADEMVTLCREHAIGVSPELPHVLNHDLCVSNKVLTYLAAGLAVIATDTRGHRSTARLAPGAIALYSPGDVVGLAALVRRWDEDRASLAAARKAAWCAAKRRLHWEHPLERGALLQAMAGALS